MGSSPVTFDQRHFRFYQDDGAINASTAVAAEDANITSSDLALDTNLRIRLVLSETGTGTLPRTSDSVRLQYRLNGGSWTNVTGSSNVCRTTASPNVADGAALTRLLSQFASNSFVDGTFDEVDGKCGVDLTSPAFNADTDVEIEYCVQMRSADLVATDYVELRVVQETGPSPYDAYNVTPKYTVASSGPPVGTLAMMGCGR